MKLRYGKGDWRKSEHQFGQRAWHIFTMYLLNRGGYMKNWPARLRAVWHAGFCLYDSEICKDCGRPVARGIGTWWTAPDGLWMEINGGYAGCLCPSCFVGRCEEKGMLIYWCPLLWQDPNNDEREERRGCRLE